MKVNMKKVFVPSVQCSSFFMVLQQTKIFQQKLHSSHLWLPVWLLICSWTCYNKSSASRAGGKTTAGPMNDPDSPNYSSKSLQEILSEGKSEINVYKTLARKCKSLLPQVATLYSLLYRLLKIHGKSMAPHFCEKGVPGHNILMVTKFFLISRHVHPWLICPWS